jgi:hypothetical protein
MRRARELTELSNLFLAIGSSLVVWPAAGFHWPPNATVRGSSSSIGIVRWPVLHDDIGTALAPFIAP